MPLHLRLKVGLSVCSGVYDDGEWLCGHCIASYADGAGG